MTLQQLEQKYFPGLGGKRIYRNTLVAPHVDSDNYFTAIADAIDLVRGPGDRIFIASWLFVPTFPLRPNTTQSLKDLLLDKADAGVDVRVIVSTPRLSLGIGLDLFSRESWPMVKSILSPMPDIVKANTRSALALRDASRTGAKPLANRVLMDWGGEMDTRHQKFTVVYKAPVDNDPEEIRAFVGGLDFTPVVRADEFHDTGYWHDAGVELRGGAAFAVHEEFITRWTEAQTLPKAEYLMIDTGIAPYNPSADATPAALPDDPIGLIPPPAATGTYTNTSVRILRSYESKRALFKGKPLPWETLPTTGVREIFDGLKRAIEQAEKYIYIEDQTINPVHFVERIFQEHSILFPLIRAALIAKQNLKVVLVTQGKEAANVPIPASLTMSVEVQELILNGLTPDQRDRFAFFAVYETKVHSKIVLVDDEFAAIGSANMWDRSMTGEESELNASILHDGGVNSLVADLRVRLWCGHLRVSSSTLIVSELRDHSTGFSIFRQAWGMPVTFDHPDSALVEIAP